MKQYNKQTLEEYYLHFDTKNTSFLKMAVLLHEQGIENFFFLALKDKSLKDVDPYDPDLTQEQQFRIFRECAENRWYYYREVYRLPESGGALGVGGGTPFILNRGNLAFLWASSLCLSAFLILPRQEGKTTAACAHLSWVWHFTRNSNILHFNKSQNDANEILRKIRESIAMIPMYMQHSNLENLDPADKRRVKNNEKMMRNTIGATVEAMASAGNEAKADAIARGRTASTIYFDELAFIFFNEAIYTAATPAYEKAREISEKNGAPYGIYITTTPGDLATPHGAFAYKMMESAIPFREEMYDWKRKKLYDVIYNTPDKTGFIFIQFSHLQLGETDDWYLERAKKMNNPIKARREYLLEWINSNGNSPFDPDDVEVIGDLAQQKRGTEEVIKINKYFNLNVYEEYHGRKPVLIGCDVSGGLGRDCSTLVVANPETLRPMAVFKSNMIPSDQFKKLIVTVVTKLYPNCILTIENNSVGKPLIDNLRDTAVNRVLYKEKKKRNIDQGVQSFTKKRTADYIEYGHNTNPTTRAQMMEILENIVHNSPGHVALPELYDEIRYLELKNGRIDHSSATHDDVTMAYMGILWIVRYGKGLKNKGIYWTISESEDDEPGYGYDTTDTQNAAEMIVLKKHNPTEEDRLVQYMKSKQSVADSASLAERERAEFYKAVAAKDDIDIDDDVTMRAIDMIPDSTQRLLLKNYYSILDQIGGDMSSNMLDQMVMPSNIALGGDGDDGMDWSNQYSF